MTDKSKRKRTSSRRRKFLLIIVPILALVIGFMASSPQIDAWLATDPFTPQCHFETDRVFATGHPIQITSINQGQYEPLDDAGSIDQIRWSPDGTMLMARDPNGNENYEAVVMSADGEIIHTFEEEVRTSPYWDGDNHTIEFSGRMYDYYVNYETWETESRLVPMSGWHITYSKGAKSPDGRYAPYAAYRDEGVAWTVRDLEGNREWSVWEWEVYKPNVRFLGWSADSQLMYFGIDHMLTQYDVESYDMTELLELPYDARYNWFSLSPNRDKIVIWDQDESAVYVNLTTLDLIRVGEQVEEGGLGWIDNRYWLYGEIKNEDEYQALYVYDTVENTSRHLNIPNMIGRSNISLSPTEQYIRYVSKYRLGKNPRGYETDIPFEFNIYDLANDTHTIIGTIQHHNDVFWFHHEGKDYLLIQKQLSPDRSQPYLTTLMDVENFTSCKIGYTSWTLRFQPQG